jgi:hypothetical protein
MSLFGLLRHRNRSGAVPRESKSARVGFHIRSRPAAAAASLRTACFVFAKPVTASCMPRGYQYINGVRRRSRRYARAPRFLDKRLGLGSVACSRYALPSDLWLARAGMKWRLSIAKRLSCPGTFVAGSDTASLVGHHQSCGSCVRHRQSRGSTHVAPKSNPTCNIIELLPHFIRSIALPVS